METEKIENEVQINFQEISAEDVEELFPDSRALFEKSEAARDNLYKPSVRRQIQEIYTELTAAASEGKDAIEYFPKCRIHPTVVNLLRKKGYQVDIESSSYTQARISWYKFI